MIFELGSEHLAENAASITSTMSRINAEDSYLFVIPQNFRTSGVGGKGLIQASKALPISVTYTVTPTDEEEPVTETYTVKGSVMHDFEQGKAYQIQIILDGRPGLSAVRFAVVDDFEWDEATENLVTGSQIRDTDMADEI